VLEFLTAGADSTVAVLQWIMANLVARPEIQARLRAEIHNVAGGAGLQEEQLTMMPYLRAVVLEGLRLHPPGHFLLPHATTEETGATLEGFRVPKRVRELHGGRHGAGRGRVARSKAVPARAIPAQRPGRGR
jgi:cytochrome P450 family 89 subfamily A